MLAGLRPDLHLPQQLLHSPPTSVHGRTPRRTVLYCATTVRRHRHAQELMSDPAVTAARKKRYAKLQAEATKYQRVKKRKTEQPRVNQKKQRPKH